jgi:hypothetical protein
MISILASPIWSGVALSLAGAATADQATNARLAREASPLIRRSSHVHTKEPGEVAGAQEITHENE